MPVSYSLAKGGDPMIRKLQDVLVFNSRPVRKDATTFNAQLLEQRREDIFLAMHQMGLLR